MARVPSLRLNRIENLDEVCDAMELCELHEVPDDGLNTMDEYKDRLKCHYWMQKHGNYKQTVSKAIVESGEDDEVKRKRLIDILKQITVVTALEHQSHSHNTAHADTRDLEDPEHPAREISADSPSLAADMLDEFLCNEGTSTNLQRDCERRIENLQNGECVILIAGETSAGKSSVLNLLFGERILPVFWGSCTAAITTVRYGHRSAKIIYDDEDTPIEELQLDEEGLARFNDLIFMQGEQREEGHSIREVQLYLPLWFLRTGLVLADTPGIGETEFLEKYLIKYISENQILGFIYVIMSDNSGGVREDRLLLLLKMIIEEQRKKEHSLPFDPRAALFVCNRFDAIQEDDRPKVKKHILEQLGKFWPEFEPAQSVFFSAKKAQRDVDAHPDYINVEYRALLGAIRKLFCVAMDRRIKSSYKWIEKLLQRIIHFLKTTVKRMDMCERDCQDKIKAIMKKLQILTTKTNTVVLTLRTDIQETAVHICNEIKQYLQKPHVKFSLCSAWKSDEIPTLSDTVKSMSHWYWVKERIDTAFYDRLCNLLEDWGQENCNIKELESKVVEDIRAKLGMLEEEICEVEQDMQQSHKSDGETRSRAGRRTSTARRVSLRSLGSGMSMCEAPTKLDLKAQLRISEKKGLIQNTFARRKSKLFQKNPQTWARERAEKLLKKLLRENPNTIEVIYPPRNTRQQDGGKLDQLVIHLLQRPLDFVDAVEERIPSLLKANEMLLRSIETTRLGQKKHNATFETIMEEIENLRTSLKEYGEGYIFVDDFKSNEVKILQTVRSGGSLTRTLTRRVQNFLSTGSEEDMMVEDTSPRGLWSVVYPGVLQQAGSEQHTIAIRFYLPSSGVKNTFAEVAKLRCLVHDDLPLAEFLGIHHAEMKLPAFIYSGALQSARRFLLQASNPRPLAHNMILSTAQALGYIHDKGLVHMELSASTVTVDEAGSVKLTGACMPRRATLPIDADTAVGEFVYLSPQVLAGDLYIASSDVYGFGLFMYELLTQRPAFKKQRAYSFSSFAKDVNPEVMLIGKIDTGPALPPKMLDIMKRCVEAQDRDRPHMVDVADLLRETEVESVYLRNSSGRIMTPANVFRTSMARERDFH